MEDSIHLVAKGWYRLYYGLILACCLAVIGLYFAGQQVPQIAPYAKQYGVDFPAMIIAAVVAGYELTAYWIVRRISEPIAILASSLVFSLVLLNGLANTDPHVASWGYVGLWVVNILLMGMFGLRLAGSALLVPIVYLLVRYDFHLTQVSMQ